MELLHTFLACLLFSSILPISSFSPSVQPPLDNLLDVALLMSDISTSFTTAPKLKWTHSNKSASLTLTVMHRDSALSPFRKEGATREELWQQRMERDSRRVEAMVDRSTSAVSGLKQSGFSSPLVSGLLQGSGEYFTRFGVGTPSHQSYMVVDTGSDISWIQCSPCSSCYKQADPIFNPSLSSSFQAIHCTSPICSKLDIHSCERRTHKCLYQVAYGDGSFTIGDFFSESLSFQGATLKNVALGCGHDNEGLFLGAAGLLGLGAGSLSFPSQVGPNFNNTFSYCLVDRDATGSSSTVLFGNMAIPRGTIFTPLIKNAKLSTFYYISMVGISVGRFHLHIPASAFSVDEHGNGGVIIDSGTSVTRLVEAAYIPLRTAFRAATKYLPPAAGLSLFDTCYNLSGKTTVKVPTLTLHFSKGANVTLPAKNYLIPVDTRGTFCFAFAATTGPLSIIGNIQQQGFRIVFDVRHRRLGFAHNQCR